MRWFRRKTPDTDPATGAFPHKIVCRDWTELVTDYVEGALPQAVVDRIERHLRKCSGCMEYLEQMRATIAAVGRLGDDDLGAMPDAMRAVLLEVYQERSAPA